MALLKRNAMSSPHCSCRNILRFTFEIEVIVYKIHALSNKKAFVILTIFNFYCSPEKVFMQFYANRLLQ